MEALPAGASVVSPLEELAASIQRVRELVADCLHDLDVAEAEVRDGVEAAVQRVESYRAECDGVVWAGWTDYPGEPPPVWSP
jgi:hypothetical protein